MFSGWGNYARISNGSSNIQGFYHEIRNGRITVTDEGLKAIITVKNNTIATKRVIMNGKTVHFVEYGKCEREKGVYSLKFRKGTNRGLDGLSTRYDGIVLGYAGTTKTLYKHGRLIWQTFRHKNGRLCYKIKAGQYKATLRHDDGSILATLEGKIGTARIFEGNAVFGHGIEEWNTTQSVFRQYSKAGHITKAGQYENRQRVGKWIRNGKQILFLNGLEVSARLYNTAPEKLKIKEVLSIKDADVRSILLNKIGFERLVKEANPIIIHKHRDMKLLRFPFAITKGDIWGEKPDKFFQLLQVKCPSTKQDYFLKVPPEFNKCEEARQWTFGLSAEAIAKGQRIKFDLEV